MSENTNNSLFDIIEKTAAFDKEVAGENSGTKPKITFKRDENGVLWSYDVNTGERIGRINEHGDEPTDK